MDHRADCRLVTRMSQVVVVVPVPLPVESIGLVKLDQVRLPELRHSQAFLDIDLEATFDEFGDVLRALAPLRLPKVKDVRVFLRNALVTDHLIRDENVQDGSQAPHVR